MSKNVTTNHAKTRLKPRKTFWRYCKVEETLENMASRLPDLEVQYMLGLG